MKLISSIILSALLAAAAGLFFPWWSIAIAGFIAAALIPQKPLPAFAGGFVGVFLLWAGLSWYISHLNHDVLAHKVSLLILKADNPTGLVLVTGMIGGLVGGLAALSGSFVRGRTATAKA